MNARFSPRRFAAGSAIVSALALIAGPTACARSGGSVGFLMSDYTTSSRWQFDRQYFVDALKKLDPDINVVISDAKTDQTKQQNQAASLLTAGAKVLIDVPVDGVQAKKIVDLAHGSNPSVPVIAYDRLIRGAPVDAYATFDPVAVGRQQAQYIVDHLKKGVIISIAGASTDNNALEYHAGAMQVLDPLVKSGRYTMPYDRYTPNWDNNTAQAETAAALNKLSNKVDAVLVANDGMASGVIAALKAQHLDGKVIVTGQDATVVGLQNVLLGTQSMTIYKPLRKLAEAAAEITDALLHGKPVPAKTKVNNGTNDVPSILLPVVTITKSNVNTVVNDGFVKKSDLCNGLPASACAGL